MAHETIEHAVVILSQRGWGQRRIAEELGIGRKLVRGILGRVLSAREYGHTALPPAPRRRTRQLDAHAAAMLELLDRHPDITAVRMLEELRPLGYTGGYSVLKERMRELRPKPKAAMVERFETGPGEQGQQDWSPYTIDFTRGGEAKVSCFSFILAFSRRQYIHFGEQEDLLTLERQHIAAGERFRGLPREILYDNQKAIVLRREAKRPVYHPRFLAFATHYGFVPIALPPRTPEWKGKVERPFQYVEGNCLNARVFRDKADLDAHALRWMDETSDRHVHDTTRERPIDRFAREQEHLVSLPAHPYDTAEVGYRVVSDEALIRWEDVPYSVPPDAVLDLVVVRATEHEIFVYRSDLSKLAVHERAPRGHTQPVIDPAHRPRKKPLHDVEALAQRLGQLGDDAARFAAGVVRTQRYRGAALAAVLALVERYDADDLVRALGRAVRYRAFDAGVVTRILAATAEPRELPSTTDERALSRLREQGAALAVSPRALAEYAVALRGDDIADGGA
jgi:transposase